MEKRQILRISVVIAVILSFVFGNVGYSSAKTLKYTMPNPLDTTVGRFASTLADLVKKESKGEIIIQVYPSSQLGGKDEMLDGVKIGTIEMVGQDFSALARFYDDLGVFNFPYLYRDGEHAGRASGPGSPIYERMNKILVEKAGVRMLGNMYYGSRMLTCNSPIYNPDGLKGKKIRAIPIPIWIAMVEGMGAIATPVDFAELSTALATGIVDGQENPLTTIWNNKFYQLQKYLMVTNHINTLSPFAVNEKVWQGLTENQRRIIVEAGQKSKKINFERGVQEEEALMLKIKEAGIKVISEKDGLDVKAFRDRVLKYCLSKFPQWNNYIKEIQEVK